MITALQKASTILKNEKLEEMKTHYKNPFTQEFLKQQLERNNNKQLSQTELNQAIKKYKLLLSEQKLKIKTEPQEQKQQSYHSHHNSNITEKPIHQRQFTSITSHEDTFLKQSPGRTIKNGNLFFLSLQTDKQIIKYYLPQVIRAYKEETDQSFRNHFKQTVQELNIGSKLKPLNQQQKITLPKQPKHENCITIVFDLDETLIHCHNQVINIRPGARNILQKLSREFEIIIFTASNRTYGEKVINYLDPEQKFISHKLYRDSCTITNGGVSTKDLRLLNRDLSKIVLIDNSSCNYAWHPENGIPIIPYYDNPDDNQLNQLYEYLQQMKLCDDVRQFNRQHLKLHKFMYQGDFGNVIKILLN